MREIKIRCGNCPLNDVAEDRFCPDYCNDMEEWINEHDQKVKTNIINDILNLIDTNYITENEIVSEIYADIEQLKEIL